MLNITCIKLVIYKPDTTNLMLVELIFYLKVSVYTFMISQDLCLSSMRCKFRLLLRYSLRTPRLLHWGRRARHAFQSSYEV